MTAALHTFVSLCLTCLLAQAPQPPRPADAKPPDPKPAETKPAAPARTPAEALLDQAVEAMAKRTGFSTTFRLEPHAPGLDCLLEGRYALAPGNKVLYERRVKLADTEAHFRQVGDGKDVWSVERLGQVTRTQVYELAGMFQALDALTPEELPADRREPVRKEIRQDLGLLGWEPLLRELKDRCAFPTLTPASLKLPGQPERAVQVLEGAWSAKTKEALAPAQKPEGETVSPAELWDKGQAGIGIPRRCRLFLGKDDLWPYRLEWYGPAAPEGPEVRLWALEVVPAEAPKEFALSAEEQKAAQRVDPANLLRLRLGRPLLPPSPAAPPTPGMP
jgi:hypothetical protein